MRIRQPPPSCRPIPEAEAPRDCPLCPRLVAFREECRVEYPDVVERAGAGVRRPRGVAGDRRPRSGQARRQPDRPAFHRRLRGRAALRDVAQVRAGRGRISRRSGDGLQLKGAIILNAVKCLPPANKPEPREIATCRTLFRGGARRASERARGGRARPDRPRRRGARDGPAAGSTKFGHGAEASAPDGRILLSSYHCSRYNQNTGRLNAAMFESVFERAIALKCPR